MATIDLGKIKLVNRGAYNNSTAYTVDDLVQSGGSTYICIQNSTGNAVTNASYWSVLAAGGTDVGATLTTQGDLLYRDGSGLQRLAKGTAGQVLKINSGATAPEWGTDQGGKIGQVLMTTVTSRQSISSSSWTDLTGGFSLSITPSATNSKIFWSFDLYTGSADQYGKVKIVYGDGSDLTTTAIGDSAGSRIRATVGGIYTGQTDHKSPCSMQGWDAPNTTSATTYKLQGRLSSGTFYINRRPWDTDNNTADTGISSFSLMEVLY